MSDKTETMQIRLSPEEKDSITKEAERLGISATAFLLLLVKQFNDGIRFEKKTANGNYPTAESKAN
jgi:hypothetical protein